MPDFERSMNTLVSKVYRDVEMLENQMLSASSLNLRIGEIHMLEALQQDGRDGMATIGELSEIFSISPPSVTTTVNKLEAKGFVKRCRCDSDGRVVEVHLTQKGSKAERAHRYFHRTMVRKIAAELSEAEKDALVKGVTKLDLFLQDSLKKYETI